MMKKGTFEGLNPLNWLSHLPEVGSPVLNLMKEWNEKQAEITRIKDEARRNIACIKAGQKKLVNFAEGYVRQQWKAEEIAQAKQAIFTKLSIGE